MSRRSTLSKAWRELASAVHENTKKPVGGPLDNLRHQLGMSQSSFHRATRGAGKFTEEQIDFVATAADMFEIENPIGDVPAKPPSYSPLRMFGEALGKGFPPARRTVEKLRGMYTPEQLTALANNDGTPEDVMRAVMVLLE